MTTTIFQVDAFTTEPFRGNPAGVCILDNEADERWMQDVATEMALSETAFLQKKDDGYSLRWFTPAAEVDLCGHGTLASAHILFEQNQLAPDAVARFHTRSGLLTVVKKAGWLEMDFPAEPDQPAPGAAKFSEALGNITIKYLGRNRMDFIVEIESEKLLRELSPDMAKVKEITTRGLIVTSVAESDEFDFASRFFAPILDIPEDPVTGSAHCCLAPYWEKRLGKSSFNARQVSKRGGVLKVRSAGDRVIIAGQAITIMRNELLV
ncbi:MAG: PhzF family phenazine biosynthesis protein [bacterium]